MLNNEYFLVTYEKRSQIYQLFGSSQDFFSIFVFFRTLRFPPFPPLPACFIILFSMSICYPLPMGAIVDTKRSTFLNNVSHCPRSEHQDMNLQSSMKTYSSTNMRVENKKRGTQKTGKKRINNTPPPPKGVGQSSPSIPARSCPAPSHLPRCYLGCESSYTTSSSHPATGRKTNKQSIKQPEEGSVHESTISAGHTETGGVGR